MPRPRPQRLPGFHPGRHDSGAIRRRVPGRGAESMRSPGIVPRDTMPTSTWKRERIDSSAWERGSATAEFAVVLPVVMVLAVLVLALARTSMVAMSCQDAANQAARVAAAGTQTNAGDIVTQLAGGDASLTLAQGDGMVEAVVTCPVLPGPLGVLPAHVQGRAYGVKA